MISNYPIQLMPDQFRTPDLADFAPLVTSAMEGLERSFKAAESARAAIIEDNTFTPHRRALEIDQVYNRYIDPAGKAAWKALIKVGPMLATMEKEADAVLAPSNSASAIALTAEIRQALKAMTDSERQAIISEAIEQGDRETVAAVLHGPEWLTGVPAIMKRTLRDAYLSRHEPDRMTTLNQMRQFNEQAKRSAATVSSLRRSFIDERLEHLISEALSSKSRTDDAMRGFDPLSQ